MADIVTARVVTYPNSTRRPTITVTLPASVPCIGGLTLESGYVHTLPKHGEGVKFSEHDNKEAFAYGRKHGLKDSSAFVRCEGKPEVIAAVAEQKRLAAAQDAAYAEEKRLKDIEAREWALEACPVDHVICRQLWSNGDLCAAEYETEDGVKVLGGDLQKCHHGWYYVPKAKVDAARERANADQAEKTARAAAKAAKETEVLAQAKAFGSRQVLRTWVTDRCCNGNDGECSFDQATEYVLPNGSRKTEYVCCH